MPTDCPQRDERLGWMGDAQIFIRTASYNMDVARFFTKWCQDVEDAQRPDGSFTDVSPFVCCGSGTAAWGDAGVICPWTVYRVYGDTRILERHYAAGARWIDYLVGTQHRTCSARPQGYGDWLSIEADTPKDVLATAYFALSTRMMANMAATLGQDRRRGEIRDPVRADQEPRSTRPTWRMTPASKATPRPTMSWRWRSICCRRKSGPPPPNTWSRTSAPRATTSAPASSAWAT